MENPLVSVFMVTYNQVAFITDALKGVVNQITDFDFEIVIGDDFSTDGTRNIICEFRNKYPDVIKVYFPDCHVGVKTNVNETLKLCKGKYIAILDGDDFWIDNSKLQQQIQLLERNDKYSFCFHNVDILNDQNQVLGEYCNFSSFKVFSLNDILENNFIPSCSVVFRNRINEKMLNSLFKIQAGDWFLHIYNAQYGDFCYLNEKMGIYRIHDKGQWSKLDFYSKLEFKLDSLLKINKAFDYRFEEQINKVLIDLVINRPVYFKDILNYFKRKLERYFK